MEHSLAGNAALTVSLALAAGMVGQALGRAAKLPGIVLLLSLGVLLGPDVLGIVQPDDLGPALQILVGFAVAVILFEGGMNLNVKRVRRQALVIRRLLTVGALVTALGGTLAAHWLMGWGWPISFLFGTLVMVTGPTVITPLLRRIKIQRRLQTVLEGEGVLLDAVGAVVAVVALEVALQFSGSTFAAGALDLVMTLGFGLAAGLAGGYCMALLLRFERVTQGLENVFTLALVLALFQFSNFVRPESGIMTVVAAGMVVGNVKTRVQHDLLEFKEQLTVMLIGMLFVLLAAGVRLSEIGELGWAGVATVLALMFVVRPLNIFLSTWGSEFSLKEKLFLCWLAPRGIVAAAIASIFAQEASEFAEASSLQALVFMVIGVTVLVQGLSGGWVARLLGLRRPTDRGYAILGANELGHALGSLLRDAGEEVIFLDSNPTACHLVEQDGFKVVFGNVLQDRTLFRAQMEDRGACIGITPNAEANLLFAQRAIERFKLPRSFVAVAPGMDEAVVRKAGAGVLFGSARDIELWAVRMRRKSATVGVWRHPAVPDPEGETLLDGRGTSLLALVARRGKRIFPVNGKDGLKEGDLVHIAIFNERAEEGRTWLEERGWLPVEEEEAPSGEPVPVPVT